MLRMKLDSKRTPKPDGRKRKGRQPADNNLQKPESTPSPEPDVEETGPAKSQANPWAKPKNDKKKANKRDIPFVDSFISSNIDALAYDPDKKQMWVRFKGKDVYTYFDVPIQVYRGFWSAPSKGHYFWEKIRKNKHIKYQKLTTCIHWIYLPQASNLNCNQQANTASIAKSLKQKIKVKHPEWNVSSEIIKVFNGHRLTCDTFLIDIVRYTNKVRVNIQDSSTGKIDFSTTTEINTSKVVDYIINRIETRRHTLSSNSHRMQLKAATNSNTIINVDKAAVMQLLNFVKEALPEYNWSDTIVNIDSGYKFQSDYYTVAVQSTKDNRCRVEIWDSWDSRKHIYEVAPDELVNVIFSKILQITLQGG